MGTKRETQEVFPERPMTRLVRRISGFLRFQVGFQGLQGFYAGFQGF